MLSKEMKFLTGIRTTMVTLVNYPKHTKNIPFCQLFLAVSLGMGNAFE